MPISKTPSKILPEKQEVKDLSIEDLMRKYEEAFLSCLNDREISSDCEYLMMKYRRAIENFLENPTPLNLNNLAEAYSQGIQFSVKNQESSVPLSELENVA